MLNRSSVIVRPKQPYLDWAAQLDDSGIVPDPNDECTIYLIPEYNDDMQALEILSKCFLITHIAQPGRQAYTGYIDSMW